MKIASAIAMSAFAAASSCSAFQPAAFVRKSTALNMGQSGLDLSGNTWKPDSGKMGSTDTGDYYPEGYVSDIAFTDGMKGSQSTGSKKTGPDLPGMDFGNDAVIQGGIDTATDIPAGMQFIPSSVPDGEFVMNVASSSSGQDFNVDVKPFCMSFEDFYAAFAPGSHPSLSVTPSAGRMDRRGGEITRLTIRCNPNGQAGVFEGDLVINLPEDDSKLSYKIKANCY